MVTFDHDPFPLLPSLAEGRLETMERRRRVNEIEITAYAPDVGM